MDLQDLEYLINLAKSLSPESKIWVFCKYLKYSKVCKPPLAKPFTLSGLFFITISIALYSIYMMQVVAMIAEVNNQITGLGASKVL